MSHRVVMTAGHVDHGKSTLLEALTGMEPDRLAEERRRGLSIELGFVWTELTEAPAPPLTVAFVDVPGHERFVRTMLAGAGAAPAALFVVAADDGWSAQSEEHRDILELLAVPVVAAVVTKAGLVDEARTAEVAGQVEKELATGSLAAPPVLVVDSVSGLGLDVLRGVLHGRVAALPTPPDLGRPRLWVDRSFAITGAGTVVTGTLAEGRLEVGDTVRILPGGAEVRIRGLQALGRRVDAAGPGTRVAVNLVGTTAGDVGRGDAVVGTGPWRVSRHADAAVRAVPGRTVDAAGAWHLHVGTADVGCRVLPVTGAVSGPGRTPTAASKSDAFGAVRLVLDEPLPLVAGDRFVLREAGRRATVGGGVIADTAPVGRPHGRARRAARAEQILVTAHAPAPERLVRLLETRSGVAPTEGLLAVAGWPAGRPLPEGVRRVGAHLALDTVVAGWSEKVRSLGPGTHERGAVADAATGGESAARPGGSDRLTADIAAHLEGSGVLVRSEGGWVLAEHADAAAAGRARRTAALLADLEAEPFAPPELEEVAARHGVDHRELNALVQRGDLVRVGRVAFTRAAVVAAAARLETLAAEVGPFTAAQAKDAWGTSRKFAIPLLEHLDALGVTRFDGQLRTLTGRRPG